MSFYPDVKKYMSPSALSSWLNQRSQFIKSYFENQKMIETKAMAAGTKIHKLIEAGLIKAQHVYDRNEETLEIEIAPGRSFLGKPDSFQKITKNTSIVHFVDFKTGKKNEWQEKLPTDVKMKATAYLVWRESGEPSAVTGHIEYIATEWDGVAKDIVPIEDKTTEIINQTYTGPELKEFSQVILKAMEDVNAYYDEWLKSTDEFVSKEDLEKYAELKKQRDTVDEAMGEIAERIMAQMEFGGKSTVTNPVGTFYITERKTYEYPENITFMVGNTLMALKDAVEIEAVAKAAKKNYELTTEPKSVSRSFGFRAAKKN